MDVPLLVLLLVTTLPSVANAICDVNVASTGIDDNNCGVGSRPCKTLQFAINKANSGQRLCLSGSFECGGRVNKSLVIDSPNRDAVMDCGGHGTGLVVTNSSRDVNISGIAFYHASEGGIWGHFTSYVDDFRISIQHIICVNPG